MKILITEDDNKILAFLKQGLEENGYVVDAAINGEESIYLATTYKYDLILLDIMLPIIDGIEVCQTLRAKNITTPIIMLTAKDTTEDKIIGLDIGADDYVPKPFSFLELLARIRVQLRTDQDTNETLSVSDLELDLKTKCAKRCGNNIPLTAKEFLLLELFMRNKNNILSEDMISSSLNNVNEVNFSNTISVFVYRLRNKIDKPYNTKLIKTIRGLGFRISDE